MALFRRKSPEERFRADVAALASKLLSATVVDRPDEFALELFFPGSAEPVVMYLSNIYYEAERAGGVDREVRIRTAVLAMERTDRPETWSDARLLLRPTLRTTSSIDMIRHNPAITEELKRRPVAAPVLPHLWDMLALDAEHSMSFVNEADLKTWGVTADEARTQAAANLGAQELPYERTGSHLKVTGPDGYASSWLLLPERLAAITHHFGSQPLVLAPSRDEVFLIAEDDPALPKLLKAACQSQLEHPRSLSAVPYSVSSGELAPWEPPGGHAAAELVGRASGILGFTEYAAQKARLDDLYQRTGEDVFVGSHVLQERADEAVWSWTSWAPGVRGLMPRATYVAFIDEGGEPYLVPWEVVLEHAGRCLTAAEGFDPLLWHYEDWPDPETMTTLRAAAVDPA